jgi:hypothetical protein
MALNIKIDFNDCYPIRTLNENFSLSSFISILQTGEAIPIGINISDEPHPLIPNVYNLAFGPLGVNNQIDDKVKLCHQNHSRLFSTIVFTGMSFLRSNRGKFLGIDGSNNARAYMYYRCIQNNYNYLKQFINIYGINYYIRILRKIKEDDDCVPFDEEDIKALPQTIVGHSPIKHEKLHNYFIFNLIQ